LGEAERHHGRHYKIFLKLCGPGRPPRMPFRHFGKFFRGKPSHILFFPRYRSGLRSSVFDGLAPETSAPAPPLAERGLVNPT